MKTPPLLLRLLREPARVDHYTPAEWNLLLRQADSANLQGRVHALLAAAGTLDRVPAAARRHLDWTLPQSERHRQAVRWEVHQIRAALAGLGLPLILLKGAAYAIADLPPAAGRLFSDIDILVPKQALPAVEAALMLNGWAGGGHDAYDQHYYRQWMHELPPMQHVLRQTVIDVHHAILPQTAAARPDPALLRAAAVALPGHENDECGADEGEIRVLAPVDMVLHSATHLFYDGEFNNGLRDLCDIAALLRHFGGEPGFWDQLAARAQQLQLGRPLFYALRYAARLLHTDVPPAATAALRASGPSRLLLCWMDSLFERALLPPHASCNDAGSGLARYLLYIRGNALRMPPLMLARHLFHKAVISPRSVPA